MSLARQRALGVAVLVVLAVLAVLAVVRPGNPFDQRHVYYAVFDTAQGLGPVDRDVRVGGVRVGEVGEVERRGDDVRVAIELEEDLTLHRDARLAMRPHTLFEGSNFVELSPGSPGAPELDEGATIPRRQTSTYVSLDEALRVLRPDVRTSLRQVIVASADTLQGDGVEGIQGTLSQAPVLARHAAPAAEAAQGSTGDELAGAVEGLARTVDGLERRKEHLVPLARRAGETATALTADDARPLDATLAALPKTLRDVRTTAPAVRRAVASTRRLADDAAPGLAPLAAALRETTPVLQRAVPVAQSATPMVHDARLIAARLAEARPALVEMFGLTEPSLDKFESLFAVFNTKTSLGAPSGVSQLVGGAFAGLNAVFRPFQTARQNPLAPGHQGRVGVYVNPLGLTGLVEALGTGGTQTPLLNGEKPKCADIAGVSPQAAEILKRVGACD